MSDASPVTTTPLSLLYEVSCSFNQLIELDELIPFIVTRTKVLLGGEAAAVILIDEQSQELYFPYTDEVAPEVDRRLAGIRFAADQGVAGWVLHNGTPQLVPDVTRDPRWYSEVDRQIGVTTRSLLCAPLRTRQGVVGVIEVCNKVDGEFTEDDLKFLDALAGSVAIAIENARLYQKVKESEARLRGEVGVLHREIAHRSRFGDIVGHSPAMQRVFRLMESAIASPITVLLQGDTGTGKELIAAAIHYNGPRRERPFVTVNCGALPDTLLETELFGHKKGAFTGALADKKGLFEIADGGTIFLDEIGETTPAMQVKLLRVLQNGEIQPVGETKPRRVDVRVISATNRDLEVETKRKRFREDLYYRLNTFPIRVPPLRDRKEDIPLLAAHLLQRTTKKFGKAVQGFSPVVLEVFTHHAWPGNVRELENEIERAVALLHDGEIVQPDVLSEKLLSMKPVRVPPGVELASLQRARSVFEQEYISEVLRQHGGNATRAAKALGISRVTLQTKIKEYGLRAE